MKTYPRGTWLVITKHNVAQGTSTYQPLMSAGINGYIDGSYDHYSIIPSFQYIRERMVGYEIYLYRKKIEGERLEHNNLAAINRLSLYAGQTFHNLTFDRKKYSTVIINEIEGSYIKATGTRRGSIKRWSFIINGACLEESLRESEPKKKQPTEPVDTHTLFSF